MSDAAELTKAREEIDQRLAAALASAEAGIAAYLAPHLAADTPTIVETTTP